MSKILIEKPIPKLIEHLHYLLDFLEQEKKDREAHPLLRTSPYYKWLSYSLIRRELFEEIRERIHVPERLHDSLIEVWRDLKDYGLEGPVRQGIMHEVLYWVSSLRAQAACSNVFFIAPIHEGIPVLKRGEGKPPKKLHFRGDFVILWSGTDGGALSAVVDVKTNYGDAIVDHRLVNTARQFSNIGLQFFIASPSTRINTTGFEYMKEIRYLLDLQKWWAHRPLQLEGPIVGAYPEAVPPPWLPQV